MGLFIPEEDERFQGRPVGFPRYKQLLSDRFGRWWRVNFLTLLGFLPLAGGIFYGVGTSSLVVLLPCSLLGGMIAGPFLAGMYDAILRGLRDDPTPWWDAYRRSWRQNWRGSLLPGALLGLMLGLYAFMGMLFWWAERSPSLGTVLLYLFSMLLVLALNTLYWPQLVLFEQRPGIRLRNCVLFWIQNFWQVLGAALLQLAYWAVIVLFAPWSLFLLLVTGAWYILFLAVFLLYGRLDGAFRIEEQMGGGAPAESADDDTI